MNVGELFVTLGFNVDDSKLKSFDQGVKNLSKEFAIVTAAAAAAIYAANSFIESTVRGSVMLSNFTQQTNMSADALQRWQAAAVAANPALTVEEVANSIAALENNLVEITRFGSGNASPFNFLGIDIAHGQTAIQVLEQLREKVQRIDRPTAVNLIQKMGLTPGFISVLTASREEFDKFINSQVRSKDTIDNLRKLAQHMATLRLQLSIWKDNAISDFVPGIIKVLDLFKDMGKAFLFVLDDVKEFAVTFPTLAKSIAASFGIIMVALKPLQVTLGALLLLLMDLAVYRKGGDSLIGRAFGDTPGGNPIDKGGNSFLGGLAEIIANIKAGDYKKGSSSPKGRYAPLLPSTENIQNGDSIFNKNTTVNNNFNILHPEGEKAGEYAAERIVRELEEMDQQPVTGGNGSRWVEKPYGWSLQDQEYKGSGY